MLTKKLKAVVIGTVILTIPLTAIPVSAKSVAENILVQYNNIKIQLNGNAVATENEPFVYNGTTYLPVRDIAEQLGFSVDWNDETKTVVLSGTGEATEPTDDAPYKTEADFLNSVDGRTFQRVSYKAAKALLSADADALAQYMVNPDDAAQAVRNLTNVYDNVEYLVLSWNLDSIKADGSVLASYEYALTGEDSVSFVSSELVKVDDAWKVNWIGLEK